MTATTLTAGPQALIVADGLERDIAERNRTVRELIHRLKAIEALHRGVPVGKLQVCTECFDKWPCQSVRLAQGKS